MADSPDSRKRRAEEGGDHPERDGLCARRRGADVSEEKIRLLVEWLGQRGAKMDAIKVARGEHGISVFAERDIGEDEVMACIPRHIALGATQAWNSRLGIIVKKNLAEGISISDEMMLWAYIAHVRVGGELADQEWGPFILSLPDESPCPLAWDEEFLQEHLGGTTVLEHVKREMSVMKEEYRNLCDALSAGNETAVMEWDDIRWANGMCRSRCFPGPELCGKDCKDESVLLPLLDMFNHRFGQAIEWRQTGGSVEFVSVGAKKKGDELFSNYGPKKNWELLFMHGFCLQDNACDTVTVSLACPSYPEDGVVGLSRRLAMLQKLGVNYKEKEGGVLSIGPFEVGRRGQIPKVLAQSAAVCMPEPSTSVGDDVAETLYFMFEDKLSALVGDSSADQVMIDNPKGEGTREYWCAVYREGQRRVLREAMSELEDGALDEICGGDGEGVQ